MDKSRSRKRKVQPEGKISFGSALKHNVKIIYLISHNNKYRLKTQVQQVKNQKKQKKLDQRIKGLTSKQFHFRK